VAVEGGRVGPVGSIQEGEKVEKKNRAKGKEFSRGSRTTRSQTGRKAEEWGALDRHINTQDTRWAGKRESFGYEGVDLKKKGLSGRGKRRSTRFGSGG